MGIWTLIIGQIVGQFCKLCWQLTKLPYSTALKLELLPS